MNLDKHQEKYIRDFARQFTFEDVQRIVYDSVSPGICLNCGAETADLEPDNEEGYCDNCGSNKGISLVQLVMGGYVTEFADDDVDDAVEADP